MVIMIDTFIEWGKKVRAQLFKPLFRFLTKMRIGPNHITFFRLLGIPLYLYYLPNKPALAVAALLIATVLDWFDGGLARHQKRDSDRGKFWDVLVDHILYVFAVFGLILLDQFSSILIAYQLLIGPITFLLATVAASEKTKTDWIIHPYYRTIYFKPWGVLALILYAFFDIDIVDETLWVVNIAMSLWTLYYVWVLLRRWKMPKKS
jgi:phosphatidylglycerophosphate synthase